MNPARDGRLLSRAMAVARHASDHRDRSRNSGENIFDDGPSLVDHEGRADAAVLEQVHDGASSTAFGLFVVPKSQGDVAFGLVPDQDLGPRASRS